jgi:prefoldin subunit 5
LEFLVAQLEQLGAEKEQLVAQMEQVRAQMKLLVAQLEELGERKELRHELEPTGPRGVDRSTPPASIQP